MKSLFDKLNQLERWLVVSGAFFLLLVLVYSAGYFYLQHKLEKTLAAIRARGEPTNWEELNEYYTAVPDEDNAALILQEAFNVMQLDVEGVDDDNLIICGNGLQPALGERLPPGLRENAKKHLVANAECLELIKQSLEKSGYRIDEDIRLQTSWGWLSHLYSISRILALDTWLAAENADLEKAAKNLINGYKLSRLTSAEPVWISRVYAYLIFSITCKSLERALNNAELSEASLAALVNELDEVEAHLFDLRWIAGERVFILTATGSPETFLSNIGGSYSSYIYGSHPGYSEIHYQIITNILFAAYCTSGLRQQDLIKYIGYSDKAVALQSEPFPKRLAEDELLQRERDDLPIIYPVAKMCGTGGYLVKEAFTLAQLRCIRAVLAVERHRLKHGKLPNNLDSLVPEFLAAVPLDPFDGRPLRYVPLAGKKINQAVLAENMSSEIWSLPELPESTPPDEYSLPLYFGRGLRVEYCGDIITKPGKGYLVYSVGNKKVDDGGTPEKPNGGGIGSDLTITIFR